VIFVVVGDDGSAVEGSGVVGVGEFFEFEAFFRLRES